MFQLQPVVAVLLYQCYTVICQEGHGLGVAPPTTPDPYAKGMPNFKELFMKEVQKQHKDYNPNPGYEPYWPQGAWVFEDDELALNGSTTKMTLVCGEECNYLFKTVKHVCAKTLDTRGVNGCAPQYCTGYYPDELHQYRTFDTYCEFLHEQCSNKNEDNYWILVHLGPCVPQAFVFKPMQESKYVFNRMWKYFSTLEDVFYNASLPSPLGITRTQATARGGPQG